ncbi:PREDICTED: probable E3 ubiquitin-protein ligase HERC4 isoform X1 [Papilio xuthus]|uniref:Probable E3 ubiquitin-protein ligase HERC4 isoform X1 n=1 Tax=Papilio xuthus TaxID=66420 RepID=A0AAJ6ZG79_PAPXU|nr:PREDICTED: probable E3 ubiquitin-protein ligase HERC4 isoform X1 [Papilio xuthus]
MFCWGNSTHHELYINGADIKDLVIKPTLSKWKESNHLQVVAAGEFHTLYLTNNGHLYSCGSNDVGQLGRHTQSSDGETPDLVETFKGCTISTVACGIQHSMALDEWGQPFSWGSDSMGQLGSNLGAHAQDKPKIIKFLAAKSVIQIACGSYHSIALTNNGDLYSWGANSYGQCGLGNMTNKETTPQQITSLFGVPIALVACGSNHTFVLSKSGAVFGWGKNSNGQLGLQDRENRYYPTHLKTLRNVKVCHISCGEDFTAFLTLDGGVFTCGSGEYGQTGHGTTRDELVPKKVMELMGSTVTQVASGRRHLLCVVGDRILACGYGARGQLGCPHMTFALAPTPVPFTPNDDSPTDNIGQSKPRKKSKMDKARSSSKGSGRFSKLDFISDIFSGPIKVFAGGDHSFLIMSNDKTLSDFRVPDAKKQILTLTLPRLAACEMFKDDDTVNQDLMAYLETVFGSLACINGSFLQANSAHYGCNTKVPGVDLKRAQEAFTLISRFENTSIKNLIFAHLTENIIKKMKASPPDAEVLRVFLIVPLYHEMRNPRRHPELQGPFAEAFNKLATYPQKIVQLWWEAQPTDYFEMLVDIFKSVIVYELHSVVRVNKKLSFTHSIVQILNALSFLNKINFVNPKKPKIPAECFYIDDLCDYVDIATDYIHWLADQDSSQPHMCNYAFLFDVQCKSLLLKIDQQVQMQMAISRAATQILTRLFFDPTFEYQRNQFLNLTVSRNHLVRDTMMQISSHDTSQLKKPLRVEFVGEEAEDAGGVRKEFFMLLLKEIFDPVYGMFKQSEETNMIWFSNNPFEDDVMYYLIGAIYGLAIYNSIIIYVPFPLVLYKKLLGESVMLDDLSDLYPTLANSLRSLLEYPDEDVEEVFSLCFAVNTIVFDEIQVHNLKENGENIPVTHENKEEYVELYVDFLLNKSVLNQFKAFDQGFQKVCGGRIIKLFRSHELMSVVIGNEEYDWEMFENNCEYKNGYTSSDPQIRWFWEVFHELSLEDKKKFLLFLTGSDRVPIQGMRDIKIRIQPVADERFYPVAHTCFNLLDLPRYNTKERLKYYLLQAIQQTQGFSLV